MGLLILIGFVEHGAFVFVLILWWPNHGFLCVGEVVIKGGWCVVAHKALGGDGVVVAHNDGSALVFGTPGQRTMHEAFHKENGIARLCADVGDAILVGLIEANIIWARVVGFVAAWQTGKSAIVGAHIGELNGNVGHAAIHIAIVIAIGA